jgi:hypothetical protein
VIVYQEEQEARARAILDYKRRKITARYMTIWFVITKASVVALPEASCPLRNVGAVVGVLFRCSFVFGGPNGPFTTAKKQRKH